MKKCLLSFVLCFLISACSWLPSWSSLNPFSSSDTKEELLGVNPYLWQATLTKLNFIPLLSADSKGGVVITDWSDANKTSGESFKVTVRITSKELRADALDVTVFKRVMRDGKWQEVAPDKCLAVELDKAILAEARRIFRRDVMAREI